MGMSASLRGLLPPQCSPRKTLTPTEEAVKNVESFAAPTSGLSDLTYDDTVLPGRIRLLLHKAEELEKKDLGGKSDPYAVITYETQRSESQACKKTIAPVWDHEVWIDISENGDNQITIELFDKDKIGKNEKMGRTTIDVRRISKQKKLSQIWDTLIGCKSGKILWSAEFTDVIVQEPNLEKMEEDNSEESSSIIDNNIIKRPSQLNPHPKECEKP